MQTNIINVADLKNPNDPQCRTWGEINAAKIHTIPLGTLVEIVGDTESAGIRLFVVFHGRDCDMTPLYWLSYGKFYDSNDNRYWTGGYSEESLKVIKNINKKIVYILGYSTPGSFEEVSRTFSKKEANDWVMQVNSEPNVMNVYGKLEIEENEIS